MIRPLLAALLLAGTAGSVLAQQPVPGVGQRVDRLEREMRAVQRKVFSGSGQYFEPEIAPPEAAAPGGIPATTPITDLTARVNALEQELSRLTGQVEQNGFKLRQIEEQLAKFKGDAELRLNTLESGAAPAGGAPAVAPGTTGAAVKPPAAVPTPAPAAPALATPAPKPAPLAPPEPAAAATAPTGDPAEDAYMEGYRLWAAKKFPEAATALKAVVAKYPKHRRASYAQNLIGRAYLDEGKPALAAEAFYASYQKMPRGERAPDSLYFLGQALMQLKKPAEACKVYDELQDVYGEKLNTTLKDRLGRARTDAKCAA